MEELRYKEYTEEESRIYNQTMDEIMEGLKNGLTFREACGAAKVHDGQLRGFIEDDALKIMIADMHYNKGIPLEKVAENLQVPLEKLKEASAEMLEDVGITAVELYRANNPDSPVGNA
jgi:hypothetical protein